MRCDLDNCRYNERAGAVISHVRIVRTNRWLHIADYPTFREVYDDTGTALALVERDDTGNRYRYYDRVDKLPKTVKKALSRVLVSPPAVSTPNRKETP